MMNNVVLMFSSTDENQNAKNEKGKVKNKNRILNRKAKWRSEDKKVKNKNGKVKNRNEITMCPPGLPYFSP